jgi:Glycosyl hydrolases related to GH101 family, GH129
MCIVWGAMRETAIVRVLALACLAWLQVVAFVWSEEIDPARVGARPIALEAEPDLEGRAEWWFPPGADAFDVPTAGGVRVRADDAHLMAWLRARSPMTLLELPAVGARYEDRTLVLIAPWPHYAELVAEAPRVDAPSSATRVGIRFRFPEGRRDATPTRIVAVWAGSRELAVAHAFRRWRSSADDLGAIPPPKTIRAHAEENPRVERLIGAVHLYVWGPPLFSRLDVDVSDWIPLARDVLSRGPDTPAGAWAGRLSEEERGRLRELADSDWPSDYLTREAARVIEAHLRDREWLGQPADRPLADVIEANRQGLGAAFPGRLHDPETWGNGMSTSMLRAIRDAGIERALVLGADLEPDSPLPAVARLADELGYLYGRYDSYHSVHDPRAHADRTWSTAQFDDAAFRRGRVIRADGSGHRGFRGRGFHFSPVAARPYVEARVNRMMEGTAHSAWFVDCDAAYEYFDDYHPDHPATRVDDVRARRDRLAWMARSHDLVIGSEGGSALLLDVVRFGHGVDTPYLGHLAPEFADPASVHYLGRHWPPEAPANSFAPIPTPPGIVRPYLDPADRVPLYRAAFGDEIVTSHHWSFASLKLADRVTERALMEALHGTAPLFHVDRSTWPGLRETVARRAAFWLELHRRIAAAPMVSFEALTADRRVQRSRWSAQGVDVTVTANFRDEPWEGFPPRSATLRDATTGESWRLSPGTAAR